MSFPDLYFAFGSNLSVEQMASRCPGSELLLPGVLAGYRLAFMGQGSKWGAGGTATIEAAAGASMNTPDNRAQGASAHTPGNSVDTPDSSVDAPDSSVDTPNNSVDTPNNSVPGVLYRMTPADVEALNGFENYPSTYDHLLVDVVGRDGRTHAAFTYQRTGGSPNPPPMKYFHHIWRAYKGFGLDEAALLHAIEVSLNHGK